MSTCGFISIASQETHALVMREGIATEIFAGVFTIECLLKLFALHGNYWGAPL